MSLDVYKRQDFAGFGTQPVRNEYDICLIELFSKSTDLFLSLIHIFLFIGGNKDDKTLPDSSRGIFLLFEEMRGGRKQDYIPHTDGKVDI